jgi:hypothetical protein
LCCRWDAHDGNVMPFRLTVMITSLHLIVTLQKPLQVIHDQYN